MIKFAAVFGLALTMISAPALAVPTVAAHTSAVVISAKSMHVTSRENGYCWTASIASKRGDAYRCMVGNGIHDPCFKLSDKTVACPVDVRTNSGVVISLTKPLPPNETAANAWQMRLASGAQCNIATGTRIPDYPFYCSGGLVCEAPPDGPPHGAVFVHCATVSNGKPGTPGSYLVTTLYE